MYVDFLEGIGRLQGLTFPAGVDKGKVNRSATIEWLIDQEWLRIQARDMGPADAD